jgi:hypothetical protein
MGVFEQAARDLVDSANAGDQNAIAMLYLVGENARKGSPFRACVVYELAMRYAKGQAGISGDALDAPKPSLPGDVYAGLWRACARGNVGPLANAFGHLRQYGNGREALVTAFALGPRLDDARLASLLRSFEGDPVGQTLAAKGMGDPDEKNLAPLVEAAGPDASIIEACYFLGACIMLARIRQCVCSGNFGADARIAKELGTPARRARRRAWR